MRVSRSVQGVALGAAVFLAAGCDMGRFASWIEGDTGSVAQTLAAKLRGAPGVPGAVIASGNQVKLLDGKVRLRVRDDGKKGDRPTMAHIHVVAELTGESGSLDACLYGNGKTRQAALVDAAERYLERAFPPVLAMVHEDATTGALRFGGTEPWAVPGFRGLLGVWSWWGTLPDEDGLFAAMHGARPFEGIAGLPADGQTHLAKVILTADGDAWSRTIEIDGNVSNVAGDRWTGVPAVKGVTLVRFATFRKADALKDGKAREAAHQTLTALRPAWLYGGEACPALALPAQLSFPPWSGDACNGGRLLDCLQECEQGSGPSCYAAAMEVEEKDEQVAEAAALYRRACKLGLASGCTNAGATLQRLRDEEKGDAADDCPERTFERVCEQAGDPWACTMIGGAWAHGDHAPKDPARARAALEKACAGDARDAACVAAQRLRKELQAGAEAPKPPGKPKKK
jgi:hypothetical protein